MTKLKCWKKIPASKGLEEFRVEWRRDDGDRFIIDKNVHYSKDFKWTGSLIKRNKNVSENIFLNKDKKSNAISKANKYMKQHDKC